MNITKIIIYKIGSIIQTIAYDNNTIQYHLQDNTDQLATESVIHGVISKSNHVNKNAFINLDEQTIGFINLLQPLANQSKIKAQLVWHGNAEKLAKFSEKVNFSGKYLVLYTRGKGKITYSRKLTCKPVFDWTVPDGVDITIRSSVAKLDNLKLVEAEYHILLEQYNQYNQLASNQVLQGTPYYKLLLKELSLHNCTQIISNDQAIYQELFSLYEIWQLPEINYTENLTLDIDNLVANKREVTTKHNAKIHLHQLAGINIIDIDSYGAKCSKEKLCYLVIEEVITMIRVNNLCGIILVDMLKGLSQDSEAQIIGKFKSLLAQDVTRSEVFGFSHTGLLEIIRHKF